MKYHKEEFKEITALELNKPEDEKYLIVALIKLESKDVDLVVINGYPFTREALSFKSSGKFNHSKAVDLFAWAYHKDIMLELINIKIEF